MEIKIENYLTEEEMKAIAIKIYTQKIEENIKQIIEARTGGQIVDSIWDRIVAQFVTELYHDYKDNILELCKSEILRTESNETSYDDTIISRIRYTLQDIYSEVVNDNILYIKNIIQSKLPDIMSSLDMDISVRLLNKK